MKQMRVLMVGGVVTMALLAPDFFALAMGQARKKPSSPEEEFPAKVCRNLPDPYSIEAERDFYAGRWVRAEKIFSCLKNKRDRNMALWGLQLGSLYLAQGQYEAARAMLRDAFVVMNDFDVFSRLEPGAASFTGAEAKKAYKGEPYEKMINSLYLGLLFYREGDLDNALASFKNGILCDSDVYGVSYKSDMPLLFALAARIGRQRGDWAMAEDYERAAREAFSLAHSDNRESVAQEERLQEELFSTSVPPSPQVARDLEERILQLQKERESRSATLPEESLRRIFEPNYSVLICVEAGRGPVKILSGDFGEQLVYATLPYRAKRFEVYVAGQRVAGQSDFFRGTDVLYQAQTRGVRKMDEILKDKADFKKQSAALGDVLMGAGSQGGGVVAAAGMAAMMTGGLADAAADVRCWSLLPQEVHVAAVSLPAGRHEAVLRVFDDSGDEIESLSVPFDIIVESGKATVIFCRIFEK